jgi:hypothetical protein
MEFACHSHFITREPGWQDIANNIKEWLGKTLLN